MTLTKSSVKTYTDVDDVFLKFNLLGYYYIKCAVLIFLAFMSNSLYCSNYVFVTEHVDYWCEDERFENNSCASLANSSEFCTKWIYSDPNSFVAQLACQEWKRTLVGTIHSFGYMVGLLFIGPLSDRFGRKNMIVMTCMLGGIFGVARSFTTNYWLYIVLEFLEGAIGDSCSPTFMLNIEMVHNDKRLIYQLFCSYGHTIGCMVLPLMAWLFPYWRNLLRAMYAPALLFFVYIWLLDESPRWLLSKGRKEEAIQIIEKAAAQNKTIIDKNDLEILSIGEEIKEVGLAKLLKDTFSSAELLKRFFICLVWWITSTFVYFGMQINSVSLEGNKYVNFVLISVVDFPGNLIITYLLINFRRKLPLIFSFMLAAIFCTSQPFVPMHLPWLSVLLFMIGKLLSSAYLCITYMFTSEIFPTYTRNSMHALCSSLGRIGSIIAPQTPLLMAYWKGLPSMVFGLASLLAGLVTLFAPDTADESLPDTVRQAEVLGKVPLPNIDPTDSSQKTIEQTKPENDNTISRL